MKNKLIDQIIEVNKHLPFKEYKANDIVFFEEQPCEYISIILKGSIYMSTFFNEKEIKFNYMKKGSLFGHNLIFNNNNKYQAHVIASEKTKIINLTKEDFLKTLQNINILENYLNYLSKVTLEDKEQIKLLRMVKIEDKIKYILCKNKGVYRYKNIASFASFIGTHRETLSRELSRLEATGLIRKDKNTIRSNCDCCDKN